MVGIEGEPDSKNTKVNQVSDIQEGNRWFGEKPE